MVISGTNIVESSALRHNTRNRRSPLRFVVVGLDRGLPWSSFIYRYLSPTLSTRRETERDPVTRCLVPCASCPVPCALCPVPSTE